MNIMQKIVVICSAGSRTGGPEACFQLVQELITLGLKAQIWLVTPPQIKGIEAEIAKGRRLGDQPELLTSQPNIFPEYECYQHEIFDGKFDGQTQFVLAEKYLHLIPYLLNSRPIVWWLSVDNAFQSLAKINLNFLRLGQVRHLHQCEYAQLVLSALGFSSEPLYDYTVVDEFFETVPLRERPIRLALNAGRKVIYPVNKFAQVLCQAEHNLEVILLQGLARQEVYDALKTSRLFYDMGNFPGNDRMYREAAIFGTPVMTLKVAGASSGAANDLANLYRPAPKDAVSNGVLQTVLHILRNPELHIDSSAKLRTTVLAEREVFRNQVMQAFIGV